MTMLLIEGVDSVGKSCHARILAKKHAEWVASLVKKVYADAFVHGYKHGLEEKWRRRAGKEKSS